MAPEISATPASGHRPAGDPIGMEPRPYFAYELTALGIERFRPDGPKRLRAIPARGPEGR